MSILLSSPHDRKVGIDLLKSALALFIMPGATGPQRDAIIRHIASMDSMSSFEVLARFEVLDLTGDTKLTITFKKAGALRGTNH